MWITFVVQNTSKSGWKSSSFFTHKKFFYPFAWVKKTSVSYYNFSLGKNKKNFQCHNILWHGGYLLSKDQENTSAQGCATFFVSGPYDQLQTSSWVTRKI